MKRVVLLVALLWPGLSLAADGVLEINQACAVETGCFRNDSAGFPVFIDQPGSYRLTSNLVAPPDTNAIEITADDVTLDLGGFTIEGPGTGTTGYGIFSLAARNARVRDGTVRGFAEMCVLLSEEAATVARVHARGCGNNGIAVGHLARVHDSSAYENGAVGILIGSRSSVERSVARNNQSHEIQASTSSRVVDCSVRTIHQTPATGIRGLGSNVLSGNTVESRNVLGFIGIDAADGSLVQGNTIRTFDGATGGTGIRVGASSIVTENSLRNFRTGVEVGDGAIVRGNSISGPANDGNSFGVFGPSSQMVLVQDNGIWLYTVGANFGGGRFFGNTVRSSAQPGSIGLNATNGAIALADNVFLLFSVNLQGPAVETGTNLYNGSTTP